MLFLVQFTDKTNSAGLRKEKLKEHLAWIKANRESIPAAGSLRTDEDSVPVGGAWAVEAESKEAVEELIHTDPYWMAGLRDTINVYHWTLAFSNNELPSD